MVGFNVSEQREIVGATFRYLSLPVCEEWDFYFLSKLSFQLRDDEDLMLKFVKLHWTALQFCSKRLRRDPDFER
jgi:hypothetical protein